MVMPQDLIPSLQSIFNSLLGEPEDAKLEIDQAHRSLGPHNTDPAQPRDVICRVHFFEGKEEIMKWYCAKKEKDFIGGKLQLP